MSAAELAYGLRLAKLASPLFENQRLSLGRRRVEISTRRSGSAQDGQRDISANFTNCAASMV